MKYTLKTEIKDSAIKDRLIESNFSSVVATSILIDKQAGEEYEDGDEYIFWDN